MSKYEYRVEEVKAGGFWGMKIEPETIETKLNEMGASGWELVNSMDFNAGESTVAKMIFIFKREATF